MNTATSNEADDPGALFAPQPVDPAWLLILLIGAAAPTALGFPGAEAAASPHACDFASHHSSSALARA